jgi:hypothetical protein
MMGLPKGYKLIIEQKKQTMQPGLSFEVQIKTSALSQL